MLGWLGNAWHGFISLIIGSLAVFGGTTPSTFSTPTASTADVISETPIAIENEELDKLKQALQEEKTARIALEQKISNRVTISNSSNTEQKKSVHITPSGVTVDAEGVIIGGVKSSNTEVAQGFSTKQIVSTLTPSIALVDSGGGTGTGVVISNGKYLLTNQHVVGNASKVRIFLPGYAGFDAFVLGKNAEVDLALIYLGDRRPPSAAFGSSAPDSLSVGDDVYALGFPYGSTLSSLTLTKGILSSRQTVDGQTLLQTDASINPGNSGGPLVDSSGKVVGINVSRLNRSFEAQGIGFAIPVDVVKAWIPSLSQYGQSRFEIYPIGSSLNIRQSAMLQMQLNEDLSCSSLGLTGTDLISCELYRGYPNDYILVQVPG